MKTIPMFEKRTWLWFSIKMNLRFIQNLLQKNICFENQIHQVRVCNTYKTHFSVKNFRGTLFLLQTSLKESKNDDNDFSFSNGPPKLLRDDSNSNWLIFMVQVDPYCVCTCLLWTVLCFEETKTWISLPDISSSPSIPLYISQTTADWAKRNKY